MTTTPATIYIVDDDPSFRVAIARLLRAAGYQVVLYESGQQLLANAPGMGAGCILLDIRMPELDGLELQERLNEIGSPLPIVFLTGHGSIETSVQAIKAGAEDVLTKPVSKSTLIEAIERSLLRHGERRDQRSKAAIPTDTSTPIDFRVELPGGLDARFCEVMDAAPVMIWVSDTDKQCVWFNRPWLTFTGRDMQQEFGNGWSQGVHPEDFDRCLETSISMHGRNSGWSIGCAVTIARIVGLMTQGFRALPGMVPFLDTSAPVPISTSTGKPRANCVAVS
jgi:CheY-like chemotaxis protein